ATFPKKDRKEFSQMKLNQHMEMSEYFQKVLVEGGDWYKKKNFHSHGPGSKYAYSNIGAALAAFVIELAVGESFESFTQKHILDPLNMKNSAWHFDQIDMSKHCKLYLPQGQVLPKYTLITFPDGGFLTSIEDMSLYLQEVIRGFEGKGKILSPESYQEMLKSHAGGEDDYSIFWEYNSAGRIGHNGSDPGVFTNLQFDPKQNQGWLIFTNTNLDKKLGSFDQIRNAWIVLRKYGPKLEAQ
ncbi:MAG: serine hydrolase, partial [Bacteroidota bacterium]